jgi:DNA repair protein RecO
VSVLTVPAVLLRAHPYSETSRILRFLTAELGVIGVLARGVRSRTSKGSASLETFAQGELTLDHRPQRDLQHFRDFHPGPGDPRRLGRDLLPFAAASYLAELVLAHAMEGGEGEGSPALFQGFASGLAALETESLDRVPGVFLAAGWGILSEFGFPPGLDACIRCGAALDDGGGICRFDILAGGLRCPACAEGEVPGSADGRPVAAGRSVAAASLGPRVGPGARAALQALAAGAPPDPLPGASAHFGILDRFALTHLGLSRTFRSAELVRGALSRSAPPRATP